MTATDAVDTAAPSARTRASGRAMGNPVAITVLGDPPADVLGEGLATARRLDELWSRFRPDSDVSRLNRSEGAPCRVHPWTVQLVRAMVDGHRRTGGDFDPTLLPALVAAGYAASRSDPTCVTDLPATAQAPGDAGGIRIADDTVTLPPGTTLDAGGIGKGLAADIIVSAAVDAGAAGVLVEIGGEVVAGGTPGASGAWRIGVEDPFHPGEHLCVVRLARGAVATSSTLRTRRVGPDGRLVHHLLDPRSGAPVATDAATVTVIAPTGARAEVLTKPGFLRPVPEYLAWLASQGAAGLVVTMDGRVHASAAWNRYL